jgi:glutathione S-transferase
MSSPLSSIVLYGFGPGFGLPEISPFVTKTEVQLKMAGLDYTKECSRPDASPKGQLPFVSDKGELIADSTFIRGHIEKSYGFDFDAGLDPRQRAEAWAIERMLENHLNSAMAYQRWLVPENFAKGPSALIPAPAHKEILGRIEAAMKAQGIARHTAPEIVELGDRSLNALSLLLAQKPFVMGECPTGVDAIAVAELVGVLTPYFSSPLRARAETYPNLVSYAARMMAHYYPDHPWGVGI